MNHEETVFGLLVESNPIPDLQNLDLVDVGSSAYLATLETRSSEVTQVDTRTEADEDKRTYWPWLTAAMVVVLVGLAVVFANQSDDAPATGQPSDLAPTTEASAEEALFDDYAAARNSGDIDAVVGLFSGNADVKRHPLDLDGYMTGSSEIRTVESQVPAVQGSGLGVEFFDIEVYGGTDVTAPDVTFSYRFFYGADGTESGGEAGCAGGITGSANIEFGIFVFLDWGFENDIACSG